jgi:hypothetical protein
VKTLSIKQPWAWLIAHGYKQIEDRSWNTDYRGQLLIHASKTWDIDESTFATLREVMATTGISIPQILPTGGIVGIVELVDCVAETELTPTLDPEQWHEPGSCFAWILKNAKALPFMPVSGKLRLFETDYTI